MAGLVRHRQTKGSATDRLRLNHRATPRLYKLEIHMDVYGVHEEIPGMAQFLVAVQSNNAHATPFHCESHRQN